MPECEHKRTEFMMRRDGIDYLRCLDCDQVFEAEDLEQAPEDDELGREVDGSEVDGSEADDAPRRKKAS